jgi:hypothetical protein
MSELTAVDLVRARQVPEEGEKMLPYDDKTGKPVRAPVGNITWGRGYNLMQIGSKGLFDVMDQYLWGSMHEHLMRYDWYRNLDAPRQSVCLDIDFNAGERGLLHFPRMLHFLSVGDWVNAALECNVTNPELKERYAVLAEILLTGHIP